MGYSDYLKGKPLINEETSAKLRALSAGARNAFPTVAGLHSLAEGANDLVKGGHAWAAEQQRLAGNPLGVNVEAIRKTDNDFRDAAAGLILGDPRGVKSLGKTATAPVSSAGPAAGPSAPAAEGDAKPGELDLATPGGQAPAARGGGMGGGGYAGPSMLERDLLGPTQKAALQGYRRAEADYAAKWADPYLAMQAQEEALQRQAIEEQKAVANVQAQAEAERSAELSSRQSDFDNSVKELSAMKVDPNRAMKNSNPLQMVFGVIAAALGGAMQGVRGGPNTALDMIDKWIDRDIEAQKFDFMAKKEGVNQKQTAYGMAMQRFGDMRQAEAIARASAKERMATEAMAMASKTKRADVMDRAAQMQVQLRKSAAEDAQKFIAYGAVGGGGGAPPDQTAIFDEDKVAGGNLLFGDAKSKEKYELGQEAARSAATIAARIKQTHDDLYSAKSLNPLEKLKLVGQLKADKAALTGAIKKVGESSDTDQSRNEGRIGGVLAPNADFRQIDSIVSDLKKTADNSAVLGGAQKIHAQRVVDKRSHKVQLRGSLGDQYTPEVDAKLRAAAVANKYKVSQ